MKSFWLLAICSIPGSMVFSQVDKYRVLDLMQNQQFDEAIAYLQPIAAADSTNIEALNYLAYAHYTNDNTREAIAWYSRILNTDSNHIASLKFLSDHYLNRMPDYSAELLHRLIALQPTKSVHYRNLGSIAKIANDADSALYYYNTAYELSPNDTRNAILLADHLIDVEQFDRADSILFAGIARDSNQIDFLRSAIRLAYKSKNYDRAIMPGERLVELNEPHLSSLSNLALCYYELKRYDDCIRICNYLKDNDLDVEAVLYYESKAWSKLKNYDLSNDLLTKCLQKAISKNAEIYYYAMAENYEGLKKYKRAISHYDTAYYLFRHPLMKYNSGRIYEANIKDTPLAKAYYRRYLSEADPQTDDERRVLEYVRKRLGKAGGTAN